MITTDKKKHW